MAETKYGKYIIYETPPSPYQLYWRKVYEEAGIKPDPHGGPLFQMNEDILEGAFYFDCGWVRKAGSEKFALKPMIHDDWPEYIGFIGSNPDDQKDLGGEVELWLGDEKHVLTKTCLVFVPAGLQHCPIIFRRVDRPILWVTCGPALKHIARYNRDPKWDKFMEPPEIPGQVLE